VLTCSLRVVSWRKLSIEEPHQRNRARLNEQLKFPQRPRSRRSAQLPLSCRQTRVVSLGRRDSENMDTIWPIRRPCYPGLSPTGESDRPGSVPANRSSRLNPVEGRLRFSFLLSHSVPFGESTNIPVRALSPLAVTEVLDPISAKRRERGRGSRTIVPCKSLGQQKELLRTYHLGSLIDADVSRAHPVLLLLN